MSVYVVLELHFLKKFLICCRNYNTSSPFSIIGFFCLHDQTIVRLQSNFTFYVRFRLDSPITPSTQRTLFSVFSKGDHQNNVLFNVYLDTQNRIRIVQGSVTYYINATADVEEWNTLCISVNPTHLLVRLNNQSYSQLVYNISYGNVKVLLGANIQSTHHTLKDVLQGSLEMFGYCGRAFSSIELAHLTVQPEKMRITKTYDSTGRLSKRLLQDKLFQEYFYQQDGTTFNPNVSVQTTHKGESILYSYDPLGNITHKVTLEKTGSIIEALHFFYDGLNRLIKETKYGVENSFRYCYLYHYDANGNRTKQVSVADDGTILTQTLYSYHSIIKDRLVEVKTLDEAHSVLSCVTYTYPSNTVHQPSIITKDSTSHTLTFEGSSLIQYGNSSYSYNEAHSRIKKETPTQTIYYTLEGQNIIHTKVVTDALVEDTYYLYDEQGMLVGYQYLDNTYYYERDILGNIIRIVDKDLKTIVEYKYDAFGNFTKELYTEVENAGTIEQQNHFYYKGYCLDKETGLYYCNSRYYDPSIGRWISPDDIGYLDYAVIGGSNLYVYCVNNPVMYVDPNGCSPLEWYHWLAIGVGAALVIASGGILIAAALGHISTATLVGAVTIGAAKGALVGAGVGIVGGAIGGGIYSGVTDADFWTSVGQGSALGFGIGAVIGAVAGGSAGANGFYNGIALEFTKNPLSNEVVLGRSGVYESLAQSRNATYFNASNARWTQVSNMRGVGSRGMVKINQSFLKQQIAAGKTFLMASNPTIAGGFYFMKEVAYLAGKRIAYIIL